MIPRCVGGSVMPCIEKLFPHLDNDDDDDEDNDEDDNEDDDEDDDEDEDEDES